MRPKKFVKRKIFNSSRNVNIFEKKNRVYEPKSISEMDKLNYLRYLLLLSCIYIKYSAGYRFDEHQRRESRNKMVYYRVSYDYFFESG